MNVQFAGSMPADSLLAAERSQRLDMTRVEVLENWYAYFGSK